MPFCGARTRRGGSCRKPPLAGRRRCKLHGGASTSPRTWEGKQRIIEVQRKRGEKFRQEHPRLFHDVSERQERRIRKAHRERVAKRERQRQQLQEEARAWVAKWKAEREYVPTTPSVFKEFARTASKEETDELFEIARERVAQQTAASPALTDQQKAQADEYLERWAGVSKPEPYVYPQHWYHGGHAPPANGTPAPIVQAVATPAPYSRAEVLEAQVERQPVHRLRRLEYADRVKDQNARGLEMIERYDLNKRRPEVQGRSLPRRRRQAPSTHDNCC